MKNSKELTRDRQNKFQIYLGEREVDLLREKAESYGMTRSEYLRNLIVFAERTKPHRGEHQSDCPESK